MAKNVNLSKGKNADVEGLDDLLKDLDKLKEAVSGDEIRRVLMRGAIVIKDEAKDRAPVKTGRLKHSIIVSYGNKQTDKDGNHSVLVVVKGGKNGAPHAHFIEYGTSQNSAHPFMRPAINAARAEATKTIADGVRDLLDKAAEK